MVAECAVLAGNVIAEVFRAIIFEKGLDLNALIKYKTEKRNEKRSIFSNLDMAGKVLSDDDCALESTSSASRVKHPEANASISLF